MSDVLLNYVLKVDILNIPPAPNTGYLRKVLAVVKPKSGVSGDIVLCQSIADVNAVTDNQDVQYLFNAGLTNVYVLPSNDLNIVTLVSDDTRYFTILISSDFDDTDIAGLDVGNFKGVVGLYSSDTTAAAYAAVENRVGFYDTAANQAKNMFYAFGNLLNSIGWLNRQYTTLPMSSDVDTLGKADNLFDQRISFAITSPQYGTRLGLFAVGSKAIIYPYVVENLRVDLQGRALQIFALNNPQYTLVEAVLLQNKLQDVINSYVENGALEEGSITITLGDNTFIANGNAVISEPSAMWRAQVTLQVGGV